MPAPRNRRPWLVAGAAIVVVSAVLAAFLLAPARRQSRISHYPHIVLITIDTLHVNSVGALSENARGTPHLDALARSGVLFSQAHTRVPITLPAHVDLMSGVPSLQHGAMANGDRLPPGLTTLAEVMQEAGYRTAAFVSLGVLGKAFGLDRGFEVYREVPQEESGRWYRTADEVFESVDSWLRESGSEPFFLWVHFSDPHEPYLPVGAPPDCELRLDGSFKGEWTLASKERVRFPLELPPGRHELTWISLRKKGPEDRPETGIQLHLSVTEELKRVSRTPLSGPEQSSDLDPSFGLVLENASHAPQTIDLEFRGDLIRPTPADVLENYEREVEWVDLHVGKLRELLKARGIEDQTLWLAVSDHGEGLFHHDRLGHAEYAFEDQLRVLWIVSGPGVPAGQRISEPALLEDVSPTLLDLVGLDAPKSMSGLSFVSCWQDGRCPGRRTWWAYAFDHARAEVVSMAGYDWPYKWLWMKGEGRYGYEVDRDPGEEKDLLRKGPRPETLRALAERFPSERRGIVQKVEARARAEEREKYIDLLRSLGYVDLGGK